MTKAYDNDPDETEGRKSAREDAERVARYSVAYAKHPVSYLPDEQKPKLPQ